jgi:hypothetical protein
MLVHKCDYHNERVKNCLLGFVVNWMPVGMIFSEFFILLNLLFFNAIGESSVNTFKDCDFRGGLLAILR